jgi:hypothetical protein
LAWTARIPAIVCLFAVAGSITDYARHGPVPSAQAIVVGLLAGATALCFVYYGALVETRFSASRALRVMPRVFLQDVVLFAILGVFFLLNSGGHGAGGTGGGAGRTRGARQNFASTLVDPAEFARILGTPEVQVRAEGFDTPIGSLAHVTGMDTRGRTRVRLWVHVHQQATAEHLWARASRSAQLVPGPGDAAVRTGGRFIYKRAGTVVELRLARADDMAVPDLAALAHAVDRRLQTS